MLNRLQFAEWLGFTRMHTLPVRVFGTDESWPRVWLDNGWGIRVTEVYPDETARIESLRFTEPFSVRWDTEQSWETAPPGWDKPRGDRYSIPTGGVWEAVTVEQAVGVLETLYRLDRAQPTTG